LAGSPALSIVTSLAAEGKTLDKPEAPPGANGNVRSGNRARWPLDEAAGAGRARVARKNPLVTGVRRDNDGWTNPKGGRAAMIARAVKIAITTRARRH